MFANSSKILLRQMSLNVLSYRHASIPLHLWTSAHSNFSFNFYYFKHGRWINFYCLRNGELYYLWNREWRKNTMRQFQANNIICKSMAGYLSFPIQTQNDSDSLDDKMTLRKRCYLSQMMAKLQLEKVVILSQFSSTWFQKNTLS